MTDPRIARPHWNRRDFLRTSAAAAAASYGMRWRLGHAADIPYEFDGSKFQLAAPEPVAVVPKSPMRRLRAAMRKARTNLKRRK